MNNLEFRNPLQAHATSPRHFYLLVLHDDVASARAILRRRQLDTETRPYLFGVYLVLEHRFGTGNVNHGRPSGTKNSLNSALLVQAKSPSKSACRWPGAERFPLWSLFTFHRPFFGAPSMIAPVTTLQHSPHRWDFLVLVVPFAFCELRSITRIVLPLIQIRRSRPSMAVLGEFLRSVSQGH
jgi:hypothetical protein